MDDKLFLLVTRSLEAVELHFKSVDLRSKDPKSLSVFVIRDDDTKIHTGNKGHGCYERPSSSEVRNPGQETNTVVWFSGHLGFP